MFRDPIVDEIRKIRDEYARSFNYDLRAIYLDLKKKQQKDQRERVSFPPRKPKRLVSFED